MSRAKTPEPRKSARAHLYNRSIATTFLVVATLTPFYSAHADARDVARRIWARLTGSLPSAALLNQLEQDVQNGNRMAVAERAIDDASGGFYNVTLKHFAAPMTNVDRSYVVPLNDFAATIMGITRDDVDFRDVFKADYIYAGNAASGASQTDADVYLSNRHFAALETARANLKDVLERKPQRVANATNASTVIDLPDTAGLLTTRTWAEAQLFMGTQRRPIKFLFSEFLCTDIDDWRNSSMPDTRVRGDVERNPGGDPNFYITNCRSCHGGLDALSTAYFYFDAFQNRQDIFLFYNPTFRPRTNADDKFVRGTTTFPAGFRPVNDSWENNVRTYRTPSGSQSFGFTNTSGQGVKSLGASIADSPQFPRCMAQKVFENACRRKMALRSKDAAVPASLAEDGLLDQLAQDFSQTNYRGSTHNFKRLWARVISLPQCVGN